MVNLEILASSSRTPGAVQELIKRERESLKVIEVYNPTDEDFKVYNNRMVNPEAWIIPNKNKDIGLGKGIQHVPKYIALRYLDQMGTYLIQKKSREDWDKKKEDYRREDRGMMEEQLAIRATSQAEQDLVTPILWKRVVADAPSFEQPEEVKEEVSQNLTPAEESLKRLGLLDKTMEANKEELINQIS